MNVFWFFIKSWHIFSPDTKVGPNSSGRAYCGKVVRGEIVDARGEGKTCETCLRIAGPK